MTHQVRGITEASGCGLLCVYRYAFNAARLVNVMNASLERFMGATALAFLVLSLLVILLTTEARGLCFSRM